MFSHIPAVLFQFNIQMNINVEIAPPKELYD